MTRWFNVTLLSPSWRSQTAFERVTNHHPQKGHQQNRQGTMTWQLISKQQSLKNSPFHTTPLDLGKSSRSNIVGEASAVLSLSEPRIPGQNLTETDDGSAAAARDPNNVSASATVRNTRDLDWAHRNHLFLCFFVWSRIFGWLVENVWKNPHLFFFGT